MISAKDFETLFRTHYTRLYRQAYSLLHDQAESEDAVSEVFAAFWKKQPDVAEGKVEDYLLRATYNYCISRLSHQQRFDEIRDDVRMEMKFQRRGNAEQDSKLQQVLLYINKELPPRTHEVFDLCYQQGKSYKEAADLLGITTSAINKHIVTGLRVLRDKFNPTSKENRNERE